MCSSSDCVISHTDTHKNTVTQVLQYWYTFVFSHKDRFIQATYFSHLKSFTMRSMWVSLCLVVYVCVGETQMWISTLGLREPAQNKATPKGVWLGWRGLINNGYTHWQTPMHLHTFKSLQKACVLVHPLRRLGVGLRKVCVNVMACDWVVQIQKVNWTQTHRRRGKRTTWKTDEQTETKGQ